MFQYLKTNEAETAYHSGAVEADTILKNGASLKNQKRRRKFIHSVFLIFLMFSINMASMFAQDIITLRNGNEIQAFVQNISEIEVKYKRSDNPNGPNYTLKKSDIFMIRYANGSRDVFTDKISTHAVETTSAPVVVQPSVQSMTEWVNEGYQDACFQGSSDAKEYHGKIGAHIALGFLFGPLAIIGTAVSNPTPEKGKDIYSYALLENDELFSNPTYRKCYRKQAKRQLIGWECLGCAFWCLFAL